MAEQGWARVLVEREEAHLGDLLELLRIPSVSTDPARREDVARAARWVAERLGRAGAPEVEVLPTGGHPVVWGRWPGAPDAPTVLVYGHYDVQPADPLELWQTPPFEPTVRDGRLYARGAADMKANLLSPLHAAEALAADGGLPVNLVFLFEGEEEIGSPNLPALIAAERDRFACDLAVSADGGMAGPETPSLTLATKGLAGCQIDLRTAPGDLHSGMYGAAVPNAAQAVARLVATFHDGEGRVAVEGFYDRVRDLTAEERADIAAAADDDATLKGQAGVDALWGEPGWTAAERRWARPTLDVNGIWGGFTGEGGKTVTPSQGHAKVSCRLVPDQDPAEILRLLARHVERHAPPGATATVTPWPGAAEPYAVGRDNPAVRAAARVLEGQYGVAPKYVRTGGTVPVLAVIRKELGADTVTLGWSLPGAQVHAPNEWYRLDDFPIARRTYAAFFAELAG